MPKIGYSVAIFYDDDGDINSVSVLENSEARHLVLSFDVGVEKRNFNIYRLGKLLAKRVQIRDAEHCVQSEQGQGSVKSADTGIQIKSVK